MILYGDRGESGKIYLTPSDGTKFEPGKQYRVSVNIKDIGKVQELFRNHIGTEFSDRFYNFVIFSCKELLEIIRSWDFGVALMLPKLSLLYIGPTFS